MAATFALEDVEKRSEKNPATFLIPPPEVRETLEVGWHAKLVFVGWDSKGRPAVERLWVKITAVAEGPQYGSVLECSPVLICGLSKGEKVSFSAKHVADYIDVAAKKK